MNMKKGVYFVTGIDTGVGKTVATGYIAKQLLEQGGKVITQKLVQTGNQDFSEDIAVHREIMGTGNLPEDALGLTAPQIFKHPASPHLAAQLDGKEVDVEKISAATQQLSKQYDVVLLEGAGGLMVPLSRNYLIIDYIAKHRYPVLLVSSAKLGSLNHTLLSLAALQRCGIDLYALVFNSCDDHQDKLIAADTRRYLKAYLSKEFPMAKWIEQPVVTLP